MKHWVYQAIIHTYISIILRKLDKKFHTLVST
jgi:hypothetical protein